MTTAVSPPVTRTSDHPESGSTSGGTSRRVAIVGAGMIGAVHRRSALLAGAEVVGVMASSPARSAQAAGAWGAAQGYASIEEVAAGNADVVHVASPNATHAPYVEQLLAAGKHVICEKPLGITAAEATRMVDLARSAGVVAAVPFVYRYHPLVRELRARVRAGELGDLNLVHGSYLQDWLLDGGASNWRVDPAAGGASRAFADIGSHWFDLVEWVTGQRFTCLVAQTSIAVAERPAAAGPSFSGASSGEPVPVRTEDAATVMMRSEAGLPGSVVISQVAAGRKNRLWFELDGSAGSAAFDQEDPESLWMGAADGSRTLVRDPSRGSAEQRRLSWLPAGHAQGYGDCFAAFVADVYAAIDGGSPEGLPTFADGLRSARVVDAVLRSALDHRWVSF